jgi:hypothetical protein
LHFAAHKRRNFLSLILDAPRGFLETFARIPVRTCLDGLGERWRTATDSIKIYPACGYLNAVLDATLSLVRAHDIAPGAVQSVAVLADIPVGYAIKRALGITPDLSRSAKRLGATVKVRTTRGKSSRNPSRSRADSPDRPKGRRWAIWRGKNTARTPPWSWEWPPRSRPQASSIAWTRWNPTTCSGWSRSIARRTWALRPAARRHRAASPCTAVSKASARRRA